MKPPFPGGLPHTQTDKALARMPIRHLHPQAVWLPFDRHRHQLCVQIGDSVQRGQLLARSLDPHTLWLHASIGGRLSAIETRTLADRQGTQVDCLRIDATETTAAEEAGMAPPLPTPQAGDLHALQRAGIGGLGGAAFATHAKSAAPLNTLVINAIECEAEIFCDQALLIHEAASLLAALPACRAFFGAERVILALSERDAPQLEYWRQALQPVQIQLHSLADIYPIGAERLLLRACTGIDLRPPQRPRDHGLLCLNLATVQAIGELLLHGRPQTTRLISVNGPDLREPGCYRVPFGTPAAELLDAAGCRLRDGVHIGGQHMGYALPRLDSPLLRASNHLHSGRAAPPPEAPCIQCGACVPVCPVELAPQHLLHAAQQQDLSALDALDLSSCLHCGCCDAVCPSHIPLAQHFLQARTDRQQQQQQQQRAELARARHQARAQRLQAEEAERKAKLAERKAALSARRSTVAPKSAAP